MKEFGLLTRSKGRTAKRKKQSGRIPVTGSNQYFQVVMTKIWCGAMAGATCLPWSMSMTKKSGLFLLTVLPNRVSAVNQALEKRFPQ
jgi:putative transposase